VIKALLFSTWRERLFHNSIISDGTIGLVFTITSVYTLGKVNALETFLIGILAFTGGLFITTMFDTQTTRVKKSVTMLSKHKRIETP